MKNLLSIFALAAALLIPANVLGAPPTEMDIPWDKKGRLISEKPLTATQCFSLTKNELKGVAKLLLHISYTHNNNGVITMTARSLDHAQSPENEFIPVTCSVQADGSCAWSGIDPATSNAGGTWFTPTLTASIKFADKINVLTYHGIRVCFSHGGAADASDILNVDVYISGQ